MLVLVFVLVLALVLVSIIVLVLVFVVALVLVLALVLIPVLVLVLVLEHWSWSWPWSLLRVVGLVLAWPWLRGMAWRCKTEMLFCLRRFKRAAVQAESGAPWARAAHPWSVRRRTVHHAAEHRAP